MTKCAECNEEIGKNNYGNNNKLLCKTCFFKGSEDQCNCIIGLEINYENTGLLRNGSSIFNMYDPDKTNLNDAAENAFKSNFKAFKFCPFCGRRIGKITYEIETHDDDDEVCFFTILLKEI